jgi:hypothetical protein
MNKRIIKKDINLIYSRTNEIINLKSKSELLHPITCKWLNNISNNDMCITKYKYERKSDDNNYYSNYKCDSNIDNYSKYLYVPPIGITSDILLKIYEIQSIDSLIEWIDNNLDSEYIKTINRIINCWIVNNIEILKEHYFILENIYKKIILKIGSPELIEKIDNKIFNLNKETKYFIEYWINKFDNYYKPDLLNDYFIYITKKYLSNI